MDAARLGTVKTLDIDHSPFSRTQHQRACNREWPRLNPGSGTGVKPCRSSRSSRAGSRSQLSCSVRLQAEQPRPAAPARFGPAPFPPWRPTRAPSPRHDLRKVTAPSPPSLRCSLSDGADTRRPPAAPGNPPAPAPPPIAPSLPNPRQLWVRAAVLATDDSGGSQWGGTAAATATVAHARNSLLNEAVLWRLPASRRRATRCLLTSRALSRRSRGEQGPVPVLPTPKASGPPTGSALANSARI
jgi:hypothetical protein